MYLSPTKVSLYMVYYWLYVCTYVIIHNDVYVIAQNLYHCTHSYVRHQQLTCNEYVCYNKFCIDKRCPVVHIHTVSIDSALSFVNFCVVAIWTFTHIFRGHIACLEPTYMHIYE